MRIISQSFSGTTDLLQMMALAHAFPADNLHVIDQPYRFSSWALDDSQNAQLWVDETGNVVAWVVMQTPFWSIDYACHPTVSEEVHPQILAWADQRARQLVGSDFGRPMWFVNVFVEQERRIRDLNVEGSFYAILNYCPHWAGPLCAGRTRPLVTSSGVYQRGYEREGQILMCPWHQWEFDLAMGEALYDGKLRVRAYRVAQEGEDVVLFVQ